MRRRPTVLTALAAAAALTLASCSGGAQDEPTEGAETSTAAAEATPAGTELPTVEGAFGEEPTITFPGTGAPADLQVEVLEEGDGTEVGPDDYVVANYHGQVWDGDVFDSSFERGAATGFGLNNVIQGWKDGLTGTQVGDRVLLSIPAELGYGDSPSGDVIQPGDTLVFVVDVVDTFAPDANGQADAVPVEPAPELPVIIEGGLGEPATISVEEGAPEPTEPVVETLATGTGEPVPATAGASVVVQFAESLWDNSQQSSTWATSGATAVPIGQGTVFDLLADIPVGSRVAFLVPGAPATDTAEAQPSVAAVVDILGAVPAPEAG
ncbi:FKBP-type peptidyl-prolyl cis-trans isomerase [Georgenia subflava]|uniref:peptidylprolyl isomerase n=1 Tax=Georgenia subflava TaxID=1622177 RepID=A0A6N7EPZ2_9MICO|nr:FKBP-type peptidyl-prolyl cis-trans isomerase [Georgenia subflava]MPV38575.1 peptidylprolyl isomerase [Georgenia subflava]